MRGEVRKKTPKKEMDNPTFFNDATWLIFVSLCNLLKAFLIQMCPNGLGIIIPNIKKT